MSHFTKMNLLTAQQEEFIQRHIGPDTDESQEMLKTIGISTIDELIDRTIPQSIRLDNELNLPSPISESDYLRHIKNVSLKNKTFKNYIGQGYYGTLTPSVILRNIFENPGWYTQYTPYQAEISQGRLESLLNFQTVVSELTGLPIANASLLDEGTAAAEAMSMFFFAKNKSIETATRKKLFIDQHLFEQTKAVLYTRAEPLGIEVVEGDFSTFVWNNEYFGAILQYPNAQGAVNNYSDFIKNGHDADAMIGMATDLMALTLLTSPGALGADCAFGNSQRFGVPLGFGGPHAAFFSTTDDMKRSIPGRIIGVSEDMYGKRVLRMALQTREQHIKREKATSNICTAQALLANMAAMYAVFHGPKGLKRIAQRINIYAQTLIDSLKEAGITVLHENIFDTITIKVDNIEAIKQKAESAHINFFYTQDNHITISLDETVNLEDLSDIINVLTLEENSVSYTYNEDLLLNNIDAALVRTDDFLTHPNFNSHHSETKMMRYIKFLENKDLSLNTSMISLGSCTMKLNAATEMMPLSWSHWSSIHPYAPFQQAQGYIDMAQELEKYLAEITGFHACSLQPNSGASGEYAGLLAIRKYHESQRQAHRNIILIPISAHGTNPASAVMAGYKVVVVKALENGNIDINDLKEKAELHADHLAGIMVTYPSTYGIFEEGIKEVIDIVHAKGGQVYMDGANMNAQVGFTSPGHIGADVCHLNLHKTFAIPHGGGGPGVGPICVAAHLAPYLPGNIVESTSAQASSAVSSAPYGSASILLISYAYIKMLGTKGLMDATRHAILNANYMKARLENHYPILYSGSQGTCAHEFIVDLRPFKKSAQIEAEDVAKRLMDYGFHAPTMSFPVAGTIMIEPTESEDKAELDRFCDALISIRQEIKEIEDGLADAKNNVLKNAPHTQLVVNDDNWDKPYSRMKAAFPLEYVQHSKFWPSVSRVNNTLGDRNLICTCEPTSAYA